MRRYLGNLARKIKDRAFRDGVIQGRVSLLLARVREHDCGKIGRTLS